MLSVRVLLIMFKNVYFRPCILIFDSLAGASRSRVVATLRDYLTCEYKAKLNKDKLFNKDTIKCACPKVPQQTNFTDCGLYLLQYVESFFSVIILIIYTYTYMEIKFVWSTPLLNLYVKISD